MRMPLAAAAIAVAGIIGVANLTTPDNAEASSLKDLRARETEEKKLKDEIAFTSEICEATISATIDWDKSGSWPAAKSLAEACDAALGAVEAACRGDKKTRVQRSVSEFSCSADQSGARLDKGVLFFGADATKDGFAVTKAELERSL